MAESKRICSIDGCNRTFNAKGFCLPHYKRWRKYGDPLGNAPRLFTTCTISGCDKPHEARGWCQTHYGRWLRYGDPQRINLTYGAVARYFREVVMTYDGDECLQWQFTRQSGYGAIKYKGRMWHVSTVICELEYGPRPTPAHQAAHSCGKGHEGCVTKRHLSWKTPADNCADKLLHDTHNRGERNPFSKLTEDDVYTIRSLKGAVSNMALGKRFGVSATTIHMIHARAKWGWLET